MQSDALMGDPKSGIELLPASAVDSESTSINGCSLLVALQKTYRDRWAILLDSVFSNDSAERIMLLNAFVKSKVVFM